MSSIVLKKAASYKVDVSFDRDGVIQESQCECGAGEGLTVHCKHAGAVLYTVTCFYETGNVLTELTCSQVTDTLELCLMHIVIPINYVLIEVN